MSTPTDYNSILNDAFDSIEKITKVPIIPQTSPSVSLQQAESLVQCPLTSKTTQFTLVNSPAVANSAIALPPGKANKQRRISGSVACSGHVELDKDHLHWVQFVIFSINKHNSI